MRNCPKCGSSRIRRGYAPDNLLVKIVGYRELLCDGCNLRYRAFVFPGTLPRSRQQRKKSQEEKSVRSQESAPTQSAVRPRSDPKRCPNCSSENTHRSHRRGLIENGASVFRVYPYRCDNCNKRFLGRRRAVAPVTE